MATGTDADNGWMPPYVGFGTIVKLLDKLREDNPTRIDKTYLSHLSGGYRSQVMSALQNLDLIDGDGNISSRLSDMAEADEQERRTMVADLLREKYPTVVEKGQQNATQGELEELFTEMGVTGETRRKCIAFYLKAAEYAEVPTSNLWKTPKAVAGPRKRTAKQTPKDSTPPPAPTPPARPFADLPPALAGLIEDLSQRGPTWTREESDQWLAGFQAILPLAYPAREPRDAIVEDEDWDEEV